MRRPCSEQLRGIAWQIVRGTSSTRMTGQAAEVEGAGTSTPIRIVLIEDSTDDALLIAAALRRDGYRLFEHRVETEEQLRHALATSTWDVILADYRLPQFSAPDALAVL